MITIITISILFWVFFIVFARVTEHLKTMEKGILQMPFLLIVGIFAVFDVVYNVILGSILFMQVPTNLNMLTLTGRMKHNLSTKNPSEWRWRLSSFTCRRLVEPWDQGHCSLN